MNKGSSNEGQVAAEPYDAYYYEHGCGRPYRRDAGWLRFFDDIAERIVRELHPRSVLDAGCAMGFLVESLRQRGVEAFGLDVSEYAISQVHSDIAPYCARASVSEPLTRHYDLIVCIEVLEHLLPRDAEKALINFCAHSETILFSSTPSDYKEATHFNVRPPEYWAEKFAQNGFFRAFEVDPGFVTPWTLCMQRADRDVRSIVRDYERRLWALTQENRGLRELAIELRNEASNRSQAATDANQSLPEPARLAETASSTTAERFGRLEQEKDYWESLARRYSQGRLMRFLAWIQGLP